MVGYFVEEKRNLWKLKESKLIWVGNSEVKETVMASGGADVASGLRSGVDQTLDGRPVPGLYVAVYSSVLFCHAYNILKIVFLITSFHIA